ncbi:MAG: hypothetical protein LBK26_01700 [Rickettsiales bacterium]|jgi:hypothetical protein|nr:hypothetical protein [Rickettsiales bacterium]
MKTYLSILSISALLCHIGVPALAADPIARPAIFSTSIDWEAVTGLRLREYQIKFGRDRTVTNIGIELYFLDAFPCYGQTESGRLWVSPAMNFEWDDSNAARGRITCLAVPKTMQFAWREVSKNANQGRTAGILVCETAAAGGTIQVHLENCTQGPEWKDYAK